MAERNGAGPSPSPHPGGCQSTEQARRTVVSAGLVGSMRHRPGPHPSGSLLPRVGEGSALLACPVSPPDLRGQTAYLAPLWPCSFRRGSSLPLADATSPQHGRVPSFLPPHFALRPRNSVLAFVTSPLRPTFPSPASGREPVPDDTRESCNSCIGCIREDRGEGPMRAKRVATRGLRPLDPLKRAKA